jgi:hypothetical protein
MWQTFFNVYLPASDSDKASRIGQSLRITLSEYPLQIVGLNTFASSVAENREQRLLPECLYRFVMDAVITGRVQDSRQFPVGG